MTRAGSKGRIMQKSILITGCSSGIGLDTAQTLRAKRWQVFASCRAQADCDRLIAEGFASPRIDYEDSATIQSGLAEVLKSTGGTLDALFNNGAYAIPGPLEDVPTAALRANLEANVIGWHDLTNRVIPVMRAQGHGRILNNSSVLGVVGMKWRGSYVATKFALEGMSDVLRMEMADANIHVVLIAPGPIITDFRKNAVFQFEKWIDWEGSARVDQYRASLHDKLHKGSEGGPQWPASAVTAKVVKALEARRPKPRYYVTTPTHAMGVLKRLLPTRWLDAILTKG